MDSHEARRDEKPDEPPAPARAQEAAETGAGEDAAPANGGRPAPQRTSTRGGSGSTAGATPKKDHRPSSRSRTRPAGKKKPDRDRY